MMKMTQIQGEAASNYTQYGWTSIGVAADEYFRIDVALSTDGKALARKTLTMMKMVMVRGK